MNVSDNSSIQYFDDVSRQWDSMRKNFFSENVREKALAVADVQAGRSAADVGAGTGYVSEGLVLRGLKVIAIDQSDAMLAVMRAKFAGNANVDYRTGSAERLPVD